MMRDRRRLPRIVQDKPEWVNGLDEESKRRLTVMDQSREVLREELRVLRAEYNKLIEDRSKTLGRLGPEDGAVFFRREQEIVKECSEIKRKLGINVNTIEAKNETQNHTVQLYIF